MMGCNQFQLGDHSYGNIRVVGKIGTVKVGKYCSIAGGVKAITVGHNSCWISTYPFSSREFKDKWGAESIGGHPLFYGDIMIGNDVWIGEDVTIRGGVKIYDGAIIAAGTFVTKNVAAYDIVGGNPMEHIGRRFKEWQIRELLEIKWWDWPDEKVLEVVPLLCSSRLGDFIERYSRNG